MKKKECFKCHEVKALSEFYKHPMMADGHLNKCKDCNKIDSNKTRRKSIEYYRAYDRGRSALPHRKKNHQKRVKKLRAKSLGAHSKVKQALRTGVLVKKPCQMCGTNAWVGAHHDDYSKPLEVMWLCPEHHAARHSFLK